MARDGSINVMCLVFQNTFFQCYSLSALKELSGQGMRGKVLFSATLTMEGTYQYTSSSAGIVLGPTLFKIHDFETMVV